MTIPVSTINFKAEAQKIGQQNKVNYNNRYTEPMPENALKDDVFMMQAMAENQAEKRAKSQDRWNKAGVLAQIGIAGAFLTTAGIALLGVLGFKKLGKNVGKQANDELNKLTGVKLKWEDFAKDKKVASLDSDTTSKSLKKAFCFGSYLLLFYLYQSL